MIYELHYDNTNTYVISGTKGMLMLDTGWAGTFTKMCKELGGQGIQLQDIKYLLVSHFHPDHMGLAGELAAQGITVIVMENQVGQIHASDYVFERDKRFAFTPIPDDEIKVIKFEESRAFLQELGIAGEIIPTPGHSDDSISLILDDGDVFVGDLYPLYELEAHDEPGVQESWKRILAAKPKRIFYGHARTAVLEDDAMFTDAPLISGEKASEVSGKELDTKSGETVNNARILCGKEPQKNAHLHDMVKKIMRYIDKGMSIDKIASKVGADREFVSDVCRMYLTHKNVGVQGILDRIEIKGR